MVNLNRLQNSKTKTKSILTQSQVRQEIKKGVNAVIQGQSILTRARAFLGFVKDQSKKLLPWSKASEDETEIVSVDMTQFQSEEGKTKLEIMYRQSWIIGRAINIRQNLKISRGLKLKFGHLSNPAKAERVTMEFLRKLHPTRPLTGLLEYLREIGTNTDIFGNGFSEKLFEPSGTLEKPADPANAEEFNGLSMIHPINIDFTRDSSGNILFHKTENRPESYTYSKDQQSFVMPFGRIAHLMYQRVGDEVLGMSLIEPIFKTGERELKIEEGITQSILTHLPLYDVIVGDEAHPATKEMIDETAQAVEGLSFKSEFVHPHWIRISQMEAFSLSKSSTYLQPFWTAIAASTGVPEFLLLGRGEGTNKATAQAMKDFIYQTIEPLQKADALFFESQILDPLMRLNGITDGVPHIEWNEITPQDSLSAADTVSTLAGVEIGGKQIITIEEAREIAGLGETVFADNPRKGKEPFNGILMKSTDVEKVLNKTQKGIILSASHLDNIEKNLLLLSKNSNHGIIKLERPQKINLSQFRRLKKFHTMTDEERVKQFPDNKHLYFFKISLLKKYNDPKKINLPSQSKLFIKNANIKLKK